MVLGVIPARYGSTRFQGKPLARIGGKPLIQLVWERVKNSKRLDEVLVATDDRRILEAVRGFGGKAVMTPADLPSGTDRVWQAASQTRANRIINVQGDEPLIPSEMIDRLVEALTEEPKTPMVTLRFRMSGQEGYADPNLVKVVTDSQGWALYFSRSPIPHRRSPKSGFFWYKHMGLYGYQRKCLEQLVGWPVSSLETAEGLEQLRALEHGVRIKVLDSLTDTVGVDTPADLERVARILGDA